MYLMCKEKGPQPFAVFRSKVIKGIMNLVIEYNIILVWIWPLVVYHSIFRICGFRIRKYSKVRQNLIYITRNKRWKLVEVITLENKKKVLKVWNVIKLRAINRECVCFPWFQSCRGHMWRPLLESLKKVSLFYVICLIVQNKL